MSMQVPEKPGTLNGTRFDDSTVTQAHPSSDFVTDLEISTLDKSGFKKLDQTQMNKSLAARTQSGLEEIDSIYINQNEGSNNISGECTPEPSQPFKFQPANFGSKRRVFNQQRSLRISDMLPKPRLVNKDAIDRLSMSKYRKVLNASNQEYVPRIEAILDSTRTFTSRNSNFDRKNQSIKT